MLRTVLIRRYLFIALLALTSVSRVSASATCEPESKPNVIGLANAFNNVVIITKDCNTVDAKAPGDRTTCGKYKNGSEVSCSDQTTPCTVRTADGKTWGNCADAHGKTCGPDGRTDLPIVMWWCTAV